MASPNETANTSASASLSVTNAMMTSMAECFALQHGTLNIPFFNGRNIPLKDFLQDVQNGAVFVPPASEGSFVKAVLGKLQGAARDSTFGKTFNTVNELIKHLKARFAPGKDYPYYHHEIENIRMRRNETVNDFHDRLNILVSGARLALEDSYGEDADKMLRPIKKCALEAFIRGLPDEIARAVDARDPKTLEDAVKHATRVETRMRSGVIPTGDTNRLFLSRQDDSRSNSRSDSPVQSNSRQSLFTYRDSRNQHFGDSRSRSPSPNATGNLDYSNFPTGILKPPRSNTESSRYPEHGYSAYSPYPYMPYPPFYQMPYLPYYSPYTQDPRFPSNSPYAQTPTAPQLARSTSPIPQATQVAPQNSNFQASFRNSNSDSRNSVGFRESRPYSPNQNSSYSPNQNSSEPRNNSDLNSQVTPRTDATTSYQNPERRPSNNQTSERPTVRFLERDQQY